MFPHASSMVQGAGFVPRSTVTLDPANKSASITLSNGNLRATRNSATADRWVSAMGTVSKSAGKFYFEGRNITNHSIGGESVGVATASFAPDSGGQCYLGTGGSVGNINGPTTLLDGTNIGIAIPSWATAGDYIQVAVDLDHRTIWFRVPGGSWNGDPTADPATNTNGIAMTGAVSTGAVLPGISCFTSGDPDVGELNFGQTPFVGTIPSGFTYWT